MVLPETALPAYLDQLPADYVQSLREHAQQAGKDIVMGTVEREFHGGDFDYYNSVVRIPAGGGAASYRKRHLVAFGEYIPPGFKWILAVLKIPLSDFTAGPATQPPLEAAREKVLPLRIARLRDPVGQRRELRNFPGDSLGGQAPLRLPMTQTTALQSRMWSRSVPSSVLLSGPCRKSLCKMMV